jgi:hypothetical protein
MNQDEAWIGKVLFVGIVGLVIWAITALLQAKSEGARRARVVIGGAIGLAVAWVVFMLAGPIGFIITLALAGAVIWIAKGTKK